MAELDFGSSLRQVQQGLLVKPLLQAFLIGAKSLEFPAAPTRTLGERPPDGWFHPSTHPLWPTRALYEWLVHPDALPVEVRDHMGVLAVTLGSAAHVFVAWCLTQMGLLPAELQRCTTCPPQLDCCEPGVLDEETGARGHLDGLLALPRQVPGDAIWEFKTVNPYSVRKVADLDLDAFRAKWPHYYAQQQEYQRITGLRLSVVVMMALSYPFEMREFHVPYDPVFASAVRDRYLQARVAAARRLPPPCTCICKGDRSGCPSRGLCSQ